MEIDEEHLFWGTPRGMLFQNIAQVPEATATVWCGILEIQILIAPTSHIYHRDYETYAYLTYHK